MYGLLNMMLLTREPSKGEFACLCRVLVGGKLFHEGTRSLGPSFGARSPQDGWFTPSPRDTWMMNVSFGGTRGHPEEVELAPYFPSLTLEAQNATF
jgi:hypothetical protein